MNYCPQCRSPLDAGARFCANCGHTLPAQAPPGPPGGPRPFAGAPGYAPPQAPGYGPPPAAPYGAPQPPGYGAAPPGPPGYGAAPVPGGGYGAAPGAVPPPPPADDGGGMKILGGCGVAGCLGAVFAALMGVGLIIVLVMLGGSSSGGGSSSPSSGPGGEVPANGSVRDLVRQQVGAYRLVGTSPLEKVPPGVVDSIGAVYMAPSGARVIHVLLVYPTESIASDRIQAVWSTSLSSLKPGQKVSRGNVTDSSGTVRGTMVAVTGGNPESFYWNNRKLVVIVEGPAPHAKGFESSAPY